MYISNWLMRLIAIVALLLTGCQSVPLAPQAVAACSQAIPTRDIDAQSSRAPQVMGTVNVKIEGGDGVLAVNACTGYAYIAGSLRVTVLKGTGIIGEVETKGDTAKSIAIDEAGDLVYVVNERSDNVTVIRGTTVVGVVPTVGRSPASVAIEPHSRFAYVVSGYKSRPLREVEGNILVLNGTQVIDNLTLGRLFFAHVVTDPLSGLIYAGDISGTIVVLKGLQEVTRHKIPTLDSLDVNPRTGEVYALAHQILYRFKEGKLIDSVELLPTMGNVGQIRVLPINGSVYVPHTGYVRGEGRILVVREMKVVEDIQVPGWAALAADPLSGNVYAANFGADFGENVDTVTVINGTKILATIKVGAHPYNVGVDPTHGWVYVSNISDGTVTVLGYPPFPKTYPYP